MASGASPLSQYYQAGLPYQAYNAAPTNVGGPAQPIGYNNTTNPVKAAQNQRAYVTEEGDELQNQTENLGNQYLQQQSGTQQYLQPIESTLATGGGGYTPAEQQQIELNPQQQQAIATEAGIAAGGQTAASVGDADRAFAASGGNPAAMATYQQRAAQSQAANAGQSETGGQVAAQQAGSAGAQAVGNASQAQQNAALGYYGNLQSEQGQQGQTEQGLTQAAYGTEAGAGNQATSNQISAAAIPTTADKIIGTAAGVAGAALLADGTSQYYKSGDDGGQDAVLGEDGAEVIIPGPEDIVNAASDPVRSNTKFMDNGTAPVPGASTPGTSNSGMPAWLQAMLAKNSGSQQTPPQPGQPGWNKTTPYSQLGTAVGKAINPNGPIAGMINRSSTQSGPFAPGSSQMPQSGSSSPATFGNSTPNSLPGGLVNRTGASIDGVPSLGDTGGGGSYLGGADASADLSGEGAVAGAFADGRTPYRVKPRMMADGSDPVMSDYIDESERNMLEKDAAGSSSGFADGRSYLAGGKMSSGFHWTSLRPHAVRPPTGGYTPLDHNPRMLADGNFPEAPSFNPNAVQTPLQAQSAMSTNQGKPQIITKPTLVHLEKEDMVVPLSYRPKAKVRPSVAMAAMKPQMGGYRARA